MEKVQTKISEIGTADKASTAPFFALMLRLAIKIRFKGLLVISSLFGASFDKLIQGFIGISEGIALLSVVPVKLLVGFAHSQNNSRVFLFLLLAEPLT